MLKVNIQLYQIANVDQHLMQILKQKITCLGFRIHLQEYPSRLPEPLDQMAHGFKLTCFNEFYAARTQRNDKLLLANRV